MKCEVIPIELKLKREFIVAGGSESLKNNFLFVIDDTGIGEASGSVHYGVSPDKIEKDLNTMANLLNGLEDGNLTGIFELLGKPVCAPAMCAISTAMMDWKSKNGRMPLYRYLNLQKPGNKPTSVTVSVGDVESLGEILKSGFKFIKIKMDADDISNWHLIDAMNKSEGVFFRIDANGSWTFDDAAGVVSSLNMDKVELIEQPFAPDARDDWLRLKELTGTTLVMDESIVTSDDVKRVAGFVDGVNIKIQKSGRLDKALDAILTARTLELKVMLGCMIESSVGIAAAWHLSGLANYLDLDGRLLLESDPFNGLTYDGELIRIADDGGHGVTFA